VVSGSWFPCVAEIRQPSSKVASLTPGSRSFVNYVPLPAYGDDNFADKCLVAFGGRRPLRLTVKEIAAAVCRAYRMDETRLRAPSQQRVAAEARAVVGWLARESGCVTLSDVARHVNRDVGSISSAVRRLSDRMGEAPELAGKVRRLKDELSNLVELEA